MTDTIYIEKLKQLVDDSDLGPERKKLWELFTYITTEEESQAVYEAVSESEENLYMLTDYLRDKIMDMKQRDPEAWEKLHIHKPQIAQILS
jgi:hypothetical protein